MLVPGLNVLLMSMPISWALNFVLPDRHVLIFVSFGPKPKVLDIVTAALKKTRKEDVEEAEPHPDSNELGVEEGRLLPLQELAQRAARYSTNLDGQVHLSEDQTTVQGSTAIIRKAELHQAAGVIVVAIKTPHRVPPNDEEALKVILTSRSRAPAVYLSSLAHPPGGAFMVKIVPR
ncbi:hypothetical protein ID866_7544 [Astraeus odoratus]|nr:hypothetical protein ID866_7544 [Astraeus odoratus]